MIDYVRLNDFFVIILIRSMCVNLVVVNCFIEEYLEILENWKFVEKV